MLFFGTITLLLFLSIGVIKKVEATIVDVEQEDFKKLQNKYLIAYYLAAFSDWLQGPYVYQLYHDYGFEEDTIAILYITGFASSSVFGSLVGYLADKFGRKLLCISYGLIYSICCLTKLSPNFYILLIGRVLGGISTSILCSTFEAWYVNEHINYHHLPTEWLNATFSKAGFFTGLLAIIAGLVADGLAASLNLGSVAPFLCAIPFLLASSYFVFTVWSEHTELHSGSENDLLFLSSLKMIFHEERILILLGFIQSAFESVMYIFIFSWTPVLSSLNPPLGIIFSIFMIAFMVGTKLYKYLIARRFRPERILFMTCVFALLCFTVISIMITSTVFMNAQDVKVPISVCFFSFVLYEISIGLYFPVMGYLRGKVIDEKYRASITNWFRCPMNIFTCLGLIVSFGSHKNALNSHGSYDDYKFSLIFCVCCILLLLMVVVCAIFCRRFTQKMKDDKNNINIEDLGNTVSVVTKIQTDSKSIRN